MSKHHPCVKKHAPDKSNNVSKEQEKPRRRKANFFGWHLKRMYPIGLKRACSPISLSSLSLSSSQNSTDSSSTDSSEPASLDQKILSALSLISPTVRRQELLDLAKIGQQPRSDEHMSTEDGRRRCSWITRNSDKLYVQFHDEYWGVPAYNDKKLFELLAMCGMLMDFNWTEILRRRYLLREAFAGFDPSNVAKMGETEITDIASNKELTLAESRVRCIVNNAKCITKVAEEYGSLSSYIWDQVGYKPLINKFRHPRNVPLRNQKAEAISKDLIGRGFRLVGPIITYAFMQAAGMTIDHLVYCFRHGECANLAGRPYGDIFQNDYA